MKLFLVSITFFISSSLFASNIELRLGEYSTGRQLRTSFGTITFFYCGLKVIRIYQDGSFDYLTIVDPGWDKVSQELYYRKNPNACSPVLYHAKATSEENEYAEGSIQVYTQFLFSLKYQDKEIFYNLKR